MSSKLEELVHNVLEVQLESGIDLRTRWPTERVANIMATHFGVEMTPELPAQAFPYVVSWYERNMGRKL